MARSSKPAPFAIYEDVRLSAPQDSAIGIVDSEEKLSKVETEEGVDAGCATALETYCEEEGECGKVDQEELQPGEVDTETDEDADDERNAATRSRVSISSVPESTWNTDAETPMPTHPPYTPPVMRPAFMRAESVRRMQMASPPPFGSRSPRRSVVRSSLSRNGTPRSVRSVTAKGSPRPRRIVSEESASEAETAKEYPLVLLHVTILPAGFPWSQESLLDLLPKATRDNMELLRTKISETVLQRGILVPHPRHEYELLEERLLEALELRQERVTKCGHFRNRHSTSSESSDFSSGKDSDSGVGSSIDGDSLVGGRCRTCHHHVKHARNGVDKKWSIEVYASNGLMRSSAWAAVWNDMERVDVQIMPYISEDVRKQLNERRDLESQEQEEEEIELVADVARHSPVRALTQPLDTTPLSFLYESAPTQSAVAPKKPKAVTSPGSPTKGARELPKIYKQASDVPATLLLKNYVCLLARDPKNIAIFFLLLGLVMIVVRPSANTARALSGLQMDSIQNATSATMEGQTHPMVQPLHQSHVQLVQKETVRPSDGTSDAKPAVFVVDDDTLMDDIVNIQEDNKEEQNIRMDEELA